MSQKQIMADAGWQRGRWSYNRDVFIDHAAKAAKAVFEACGGDASLWKSWTHPSGRMQRLAHQLAATALDENPNQSTYDLYTQIIHFPCNGRNIPFSNGNIWRDDGFIAWEDAPSAVQAAYDAFRAVYLQLWLSARTHDEATALPPRQGPRLVHDAAGES